MTTTTPHPFLLLGTSLPPLTFNPAVDAAPETIAGVADYLRFYQLDFTTEAGTRLFPAVQHRIGNIDAAGYRITTQYWSVPQATATVFVVHGYYDHVGLFAHVICWCLQRGYHVVAFDLPGHGLSSGTPASIGSFAEYVTVMQACFAHSAAQFTQPWYGLGQSTGSAILLKLLLEQPAQYPLQKTVLLAPLIKPWHWSQRKWKYLLFGRLLGRWVTSRPREYSVNSGDTAFGDFVRYRDPLQCDRLPVAWVTAMKEWADSFATLSVSAATPLIIQGTADTSVDWENNLAQLRDKLPHASIVLLPSAAHHLANETPAFREKWMALANKYFDN